MPSVEDYPIYNDTILTSTIVSSQATNILNNPQNTNPIMSNADIKVPTIAPYMSIPKKPVAVAAKSDDAMFKAALMDFFATGVINDKLAAAFMKSGSTPSPLDWLEVKNNYALTDAQIGMLREAHSKYFGLSTDEIAPMATTPAKKPNYLLWGGVAVVGFLLVRKLLK